MEALRKFEGCSREEIEVVMRTKGARKAIESMQRLADLAIQLGEQWKSERVRADALLTVGEDKAGVLADERAKGIHSDRCRALSRIASFARLALIEAAGDLKITETTAGTGLDEMDRALLSQVSGWCDRW